MLVMICDIGRIPYHDVDDFIFRFHLGNKDDEFYKDCIIQYIQYDQAYKPSVGELIIVGKQVYKVVSVIIDYQENALFVMVE